MTVFLVPNETKPKALLVARQAAEILAGEGVAVLAPGDTLAGVSAALSVPPEKGYMQADVVVTVGGDGTMLHSARQMLGAPRPLLGINTGQLGFLTLVEYDELDKLLRLPAGEYEVEERTMLRADYWGDNNRTQTMLALNDVVLFKSEIEKSISLDIYCDEVMVSGFRGDGVIFATPTGSTAYSMSAGGPIVDARLGGVIVTQICAHVVQMPPMIFAPGRRLCVEPQDGQPVFISYDGMRGQLLSPGQRITLSQADKTMPLVQFADADQLKSIDRKLKGRQA